MLFLLNTVVVKTQLQLELPPKLRALERNSSDSVLKACCELYGAYPRLEYDRPDIARWYCTLLETKFPDAGGALFYATSSGHAGKLAKVALPDLARFWNLQNKGVNIAEAVRSEIWASAKLVA